MARFWDEKSGRALTTAIDELEARTSAELVIAVRPRSSSFLHVDMGVGIAVGLAVLLLHVYGPLPVGWHYLVAEPLLAGALGGWIASKLPPLQRLLSRRRVREENVERAARSEFMERGVHNTRERTGILFYVSLVEQTSAVVVDSGIELAVPRDEWQACVLRLRDMTEAGVCANQLSDAIAKMGDILELHLPKGHDDVNELANEVHR